MANFCPHCNNLLREDETICSNCGRPVEKKKPLKPAVRLALYLFTLSILTAFASTYLTPWLLSKTGELTDTELDITEISESSSLYLNLFTGSNLLVILSLSIALVVFIIILLIVKKF